jgi:two-component system OmpR family response regulator
MKMERNGIGKRFDASIPFPPGLTDRKSIRGFYAVPGIEKKRMLVIDETKETGRLLQDAFSDAGHSVVSVESGEEGLSRLSEAAFDIAIIGCGSRIDGWSVARLLKERFPGTLVLMIACMGRGGMIEKMNEKSVDFLIYKPFLLEDLRQTVEIILLSKPF